MKRALFLLWLLAPTLAQAQLTATLLPGSDVRYVASDQRGSFEGVAPVERLELTLYPDSLGRSHLRVTVRPERFDSGNFIRDVNARRTVFESDAFPEIIFALERVMGLQALPEGSSEADLAGTLELHGVTQPLTVRVRLERAGEALSASGSFFVRLSDHGMSRPSFLFYTVADEVTVAFELRLRLSGPGE